MFFPALKAYFCKHGKNEAAFAAGKKDFFDKVNFAEFVSRAKRVWQSHLLLIKNEPLKPGLALNHTKQMKASES